MVTVYDFLSNFILLLKQDKKDSCSGPLALEDTTYYKYPCILSSMWMLSDGTTQPIPLNISAQMISTGPSETGS